MTGNIRNEYTGNICSYLRLAGKRIIVAGEAHIISQRAEKTGFYGPVSVIQKIKFYRNRLVGTIGPSVNTIQSLSGQYAILYLTPAFIYFINQFIGKKGDLLLAILFFGKIQLVSNTLSVVIQSPDQFKNDIDP